MAFDPVDKGAMPGYYNATEASWGGYPVSDSTGGYYLFHAQMAHHCPLGSWKSNSIVARSRSVSGEVQGPYAFDSLVQAPFAHNPTIRRAANGTYVIYFIGSWQTNASTCTSPDANAAWPTATPAGSSAAAQPADAGALRDHIDSSPAACTGLNWPKTCGPDMPGPMGDCCGPEDAPYQGNGGCGIAMASSATLDGPWTVQPLKISDQWRSNEVYCTHTNPAPVFLPNGTVVIAFNAGFCNKQLETIGIASAPSWDGEYTLLTTDAVLRNPDGSPHRCEDPFLWHTSRGWHLLTHNQQGPQTTSSYGYSEDGIVWTLSPSTPHNCTLRYTDGTSAEASGCGNRPQLVFDDVNGSNGASGPPRWLVNGAQAAKPNGGKGTWTLFRPLEQ